MATSDHPGRSKDGGFLPLNGSSKGRDQTYQPLDARPFKLKPMQTITGASGIVARCEAFKTNSTGGVPKGTLKGELVDCNEVDGAIPEATTNDPTTWLRGRGY